MKNIFRLVFIVTCINVYSQKPSDATLIGHVKHRKTDEHISFITVMVKGTGIGSITDSTGHYHIANLPLGNVIIRAQGVGYQPVEKKISIKSGETRELNFLLEDDVVQLNEVVVSANRNETPRKEAPIVVNVITSKIFEGNNSTCLAQGLNFKPGLRVESNCQNCGFQQVRINGLSGQYTQILIDSRPVFTSLSSVYGIEQIPVNMIDRVEVLRGGGSALFGSNAIAGVVNIITREPQLNSYELKHNVGLIGGTSPDQNTTLNTSIVRDDGKAGVCLYAAYRVRAPYDANNDGFSEVGKIRNNTLGFRTFIKFPNRGKLTIEYHNLNEFRRGGNLFDLPPHETDITEQTEHQINGGGLGYTWFSKDKMKKINAFSSLQHIDRKSYYGARQDLNAYGSTKDFIVINGMQYIRSFEKVIFMPADLTTGVEYSFNNLRDKMPGYNRDISQQVQIAAFFVQNEWKNKHVSILAGVRADQHNLVKNPIVSPRLNLRYNITDSFQTRLSFSSGFRAPQTFDEDLHIAAVGGEAMIIRLADNLKTEKSFSSSFSFDWYKQLGNMQVNLLAEGFYTYLTDVFILKEIGTDAQNNIMMERQNGSGATVKGINLELQLVPGEKYRFQSGYTIQKSLYETPYRWSDDSSAALVKKMLRSPNQYGYMTFSYIPAYRWLISLTGTYTGSMLVPHFAGYISNDELKETSSFFDLNIKTNYSFSIKKIVYLKLCIGVNNILNSYQRDFDRGVYRDAGYMYGPSAPRTYFISIKMGSVTGD